MQVKASALIAIRDALIAEDIQEAYHQLRMIVDPNNDVWLAEHNHWAELEREASKEVADAYRGGFVEYMGS